MRSGAPTSKATLPWGKRAVQTGDMGNRPARSRGPTYSSRRVAVTPDWSSNPSHRRTGRRGYFGKRGSTSLSAQRQNVEPRAETTGRA
jgi:hypothetical protein